MRCTGFAVERPVVAGGLTVTIAAVAWVAVSLVFGRGVEPVATFGFALVFTAAYLGLALALADRSAAGDWL
ncbi:hypothetical protein ACKVMT_11120 [Halobacteriales archaeon Cl-PHB]